MEACSRKKKYTFQLALSAVSVSVMTNALQKGTATPRDTVLRTSVFVYGTALLLFFSEIRRFEAVVEDRHDG